MIIITVIDTGELHVVDLVSVDFQPEASVTEHPVELGSVVSDHVQRRPMRFVAEVFVTDSPLATSTITLRNTRQATLFFERNVGSLCNVDIAGEGRFTNYVLEACPHRRGLEGGRTYSLRFRELRIASAISVLIPPRLPAPEAQTGMPDGQDLGQQATTAVDVTSESTVFAGLAAAGGLVKQAAGGIARSLFGGG